MKHPIHKKLGTFAVGLLLAALCVGCSGDASEEAAIKNLPKDPAATPHPVATGGTVSGEEAVLVPQQQRPAGN